MRSEGGELRIRTKMVRGEYSKGCGGENTGVRRGEGSIRRIRP